MDDKVKWYVGDDEYKLKPKPKPKIKSNTTTNEDYTFFGS